MGMNRFSVRLISFLLNQLQMNLVYVVGIDLHHSDTLWQELGVVVSTVNAAFGNVLYLPVCHLVAIIKFLFQQTQGEGPKAMPGHFACISHPLDTKDHQQMIKHTRAHGITTVAMESTGTYWQTLFDPLQTERFEVLLVDGNQTKNVKGRKTDVIDCMWIQKLHSLGLLSGSFLLSNVLQEMRTYYIDFA